MEQEIAKGFVRDAVVWVHWSLVIIGIVATVGFFRLQFFDDELTLDFAIQEPVQKKGK